MTESPPERRVIRVFPDYSRDWPLWENSTPDRDVGYTTTPATYGLSEQLTARIAVWNAFWEAHFDDAHGWDSVRARDRWGATGEEIARLLSEEVAAFADVRYEPWPLRGPVRPG